jgi:hypothetical protein
VLGVPRGHGGPAATAPASAAGPVDASLRGVHVFAQWGIADKSANRAGLITTEGAEYVIY